MTEHKSQRLLHSLLLMVAMEMVCCYSVLPAESGTQEPPPKVLAYSEGDMDMSKAMNYLKAYGYMDNPDDDTKKSLMMFQDFHHLEMTGELDAQTKEEMSKPRCGLKDMMKPDMRRVKRYTFWPGNPKFTKPITWRVRHFSSRFSNNDQRVILEKAFAHWTKVANIHAREVTTEEPDIWVSFVRGQHDDYYPFYGQQDINLAHAFSPPHDGKDARGVTSDVHFNEDKNWAGEREPQRNEINMLQVAVHEIGHALGLGHSSVYGAIMFASYDYKPYRDFQLHSDDILGIQYLYGPSRAATTMPPMPTMSTTRKPPTTRTDRPGTTTTVAPRTKPDLCLDGIDAASILHGELFMFKGRYFWRARKGYQSFSDGYPVHTRHFWPDLPRGLRRIDAVYQSKHNNHEIVFFSGAKFWRFNGNHLKTGFPAEGKPLTDLGLPSYVDRVDAIFTWAQNGQTYIFSSDRYWKFDEMDRKVRSASAKAIGNWRGLPTDIDSALQDWDGRTYFFKGQTQYLFDDLRMQVKAGYPKTSRGEWWFDCKADLGKASTERPLSTPSSSGSTGMLSVGLIGLVLLAVIY